MRGLDIAFTSSKTFPAPCRSPSRTRPRPFLRSRAPREAGGSHAAAGAAPRARAWSDRPLDDPRHDRPVAPSCGSLTQSTHTREPVPRACGPRALTRPSDAGTPTRRAVESSTSGHLLRTVFRCPPNRGNITMKPQPLTGNCKEAPLIIRGYTWQNGPNPSTDQPYAKSARLA